VSTAERYDVIVIGAGAGGMTAAAVAAAEGLSVLLLEKSTQAGGTTSVSGGMVWIPGNPKFAAAERESDRERAREYLGHTLPPEHDRLLTETYLDRAPDAIAYLEARTAVAFRPVTFYPDYYPDLPGASLGGRVLEPMAFDARELGKDFQLLRPPLPEFTLFGGMMVDRADIPHLRKATKSLRSGLRVLRLLARYAWDRLSFDRGAHLVLGNALAARLLKSVRSLGVTLRTGVESIELIVEGDRVTGVSIGRSTHIEANKAVVLATGGFSHDAALRAQYLHPQAGLSSAVCATNTGDGLRMGTSAGATVGADNTNGAFWVPVSRFKRPDGTPAVFPHTVTDRGKPGLIAVDARGQRFVNEAMSYHEFVQAMFRADAVPAWLICDQTCMWKYGMGAVRPFTRSLKQPLASGYLSQGRTLRELADALGIDAEGLERTVERYNADARSGIDSQFQKGSNAYHKYVGDPAHTPNPCVAPLKHPPYYGLAVYPGDLGTVAGLRTNEHAQVLNAAGKPIAGLYACGNDMSSIMAGAYPGPGITLGPALTFGYVAAMHVARSADRRVSA